MVQERESGARAVQPTLSAMPSQSDGATGGQAADIQAYRLARRLVPRETLLRRLRTLPDDVRVALLAAPAGYGKTTAARQWVRRGLGWSGWLQADAEHSDPARLARDLALALSRSAAP